ncbi:MULTISPECIES: BTAD domain-containing putative transcriptional regulator [unclassified Streptomyces]|uniref:AfsR/SARP family transcriptional regulator n=1 Tax=unclassified Streptomyces TaxID=2593676 RepID=UPI0033AE7CE5
MGEALRFEVLGPVRVWRAERELDPGFPQQRALLALLLAHAGRSVPMSEIVDVLWAERPPASALNVVRRYAGALRRLLEPGLPPRAPGRRLLRRTGGYLLEATSDEVDLLRFRELTRQGKRAAATGRPETAARQFVLALEEWRGQVAMGAPARVREHVQFTAVQRELLETAGLAADAALLCGRAEQVLPALRRATAHDPLDESLHARLVLALAARGLQAEALGAYEDIRRRLTRELGLTPGAELAAAHTRVLRQDVGRRLKRGPVVQLGHPIGVTRTKPTSEAGLTALGPTEAGLTALGPTEAGLTALGPDEHGPVALGPAEVGPAALGPAGFGLAAPGLARSEPATPALARPGSAVPAPAEPGPAVPAPAQPGPVAVGPAGFGLAAPGVAEFGPGVAGRAEPGPAPADPVVPGLDTPGSFALRLAPDASFAPASALPWLAAPGVAPGPTASASVHPRLAEHAGQPDHNPTAVPPGGLCGGPNPTAVTPGGLGGGSAPAAVNPGSLCGGPTLAALTPGGLDRPVAGVGGGGGGGDVALVRPAQLPSAPGFFVGRVGELEWLEEAGSAAGVVLVGGMPGVGKSALALHWAHRVADRFPDGQVYVALRGSDPARPVVEPADALRGMLAALGVPAPRMPDGIDALTGAYRTLLARRRVLVVLDDAAGTGQLRPLLPAGPGCLALVTSRHALPGLVASGARPLRLAPPTAEDAHALLAGRIGAERAAAEAPAADEIVTRCGRLPLALTTVAARAVGRRDMPLASMAAGLREAHGSLDALATTREAFLGSYRLLAPDSRRLFRLLPRHEGPDITPAGAAALAGLPVRRARLSLSMLADAHLLSEPAPGRYTLHDLLRVFATERAEAEGRPGGS